MIKMDSRELKEMEKQLKTMAERSFPFATKAAVNQMAFKSREFAQQNIRNQMVTRNKWTERSVMVEPTKTLRIAQQASVVGSVEDYMETQEFGGVERSKGKAGVAIPTSTASGEGQSARPRQRMVRRANQMQQIKLARNKLRASSRAERNLLAIKQAASTGRKFVFLDLQKRTGIYKLEGGKRKPRIKLIHDMSNQSIRIPANPWLKPAVDKMTRIAPGLYFSALKFQLKRQGLM